jgi:hypothetical protein
MPGEDEHTQDYKTSWVCPSLDLPVDPAGLWGGQEKRHHSTFSRGILIGSAPVGA